MNYADELIATSLLCKSIQTRRFLIARYYMPKIIPDILTNYILPFDWDVRKVWAINRDAVEVPCSKFAYLLELPLWSSVPRKGLLFDTRPIDVIRDPNLSIYQTQRLQETELRHPIEVLVGFGESDRWWILDGVHRIAKHFILQHPTIRVRFHDISTIPAIRVDR